MQPNEKEMQNKMAEVQKKLGTIIVDGVAGTEGNSVKIQINCNYEAIKVIIDPVLLQQSPEVLSELVASAITAATRNATATIQKEMFSILSGFGGAA